jgi:predicted metalloprotease
MPPGDNPGRTRWPVHSAAMKWKRATKNYVEDRRGAGGGLGGGLGGGGGIPIPIPGGAGAGGLGLIVVLIFIAIQLFGGGLFGGGGGTSTDTTIPGGAGGIQAPPADGGMPDTDEEQIAFIQSVTEDIQVAWTEAFAQSGKTYDDTNVVVYDGGVQTGCGSASSAAGPFYCPADRRVFIDLSFFADLKDRFGAPGDFAMAYVIAHEFGHHVQTLLGISDQVRSAQQQNPDLANQLSIRMELQADCFAGVWAHSVWTQPGEGTVDSLEESDIREGLEAAAAVGDDRIQQQSGGTVNPESWTHGSSEQRQQWFKTGFDRGNAEACDTFADLR